MMLTRRSLAGLCAAAACAPALIGRARAQSWPSRHVRLIVPFPAGGGTDAVARILANRLSEIWGQQMVIENKGGAGSNIGAEAVARAEPDGYTLLIGSLPVAVNRFLYSSLSYDSVTDFAPVSLICTYPNLMVVPNSSPAKSVMEFIAYAKANRGKITFASSGTGTSPHLSGELFKRMTGIEMTHVPYRGVAPALQRRHSRPRRRHVQHHGGCPAARPLGSGARACGDLGQALPDRAGVPDRGGIRRAGLRRVVLVRVLRCRPRRRPRS